jgi:hypothetical protein
MPFPCFLKSSFGCNRTANRGSAGPPRANLIPQRYAASWCLFRFVFSLAWCPAGILVKFLWFAYKSQDGPCTKARKSCWYPGTSTRSCSLIHDIFSAGPRTSFWQPELPSLAGASELPKKKKNATRWMGLPTSHTRRRCPDDEA